MKITPDMTRSYRNCNNCHNTQLTPDYIYLAILAALYMADINPEENIHKDKAPQLAEFEERKNKNEKQTNRDEAKRTRSLSSSRRLKPADDPCSRDKEKISGNTVVPISRRYVRVRQSYSNLFKGYTLRCGDFTMEQKLKQRICKEFCVKLQISATDTFEMLNKAFPNNAPKRTTVFEWHSRFKAGRISIEDDPRQGRPTFQRTDENVQKITDLIKENPRTTLLELEQDTGISKTTIGRIVTEDLRFKKTPAKFIPRFLTNEQKLCRLATCEDMLEMTRTDPEWKDKIITGDETWVYGYDPETKRQSAEWRGQGDPRPKKSRILKSRNKVLLVAFLDNKGIVHHEYLPAGQTHSSPSKGSDSKKKRPEKWTNGDWILHHDNARPHTAHLVTSFLAKNGTEILPQPPYSPDIAPNDFFLFPKLKAVLKGRHFDTREDIIEKSLLALKSIPKEAYKNVSTIGRNDGASALKQGGITLKSFNKKILKKSHLFFYGPSPGTYGTYLKSKPSPAVKEPIKGLKQWTMVGRRWMIEKGRYLRTLAGDQIGPCTLITIPANWGGGDVLSVEQIGSCTLITIPAN
ncbi:hypothetical protein LAZ67_2004387 [Cordylochernes scorpioides]|uniref:Mos1 transposase HTH domain-containing protein n=1 Tax=Cordylochernes scorpioides TaxID=51811 RepID=A0ABY6K5D6_9ARAC|nr:hypothetical protein LAZ67_2004387 [Cordylochernes scorpioides]